MEYFETPESRAFALKAAKLGCAQCGAQIRIPPSGDPFSAGPCVGRYWCNSCWDVFYSEHPEHLADEESVEYVNRMARQVRIDRAMKESEVLFREGENVAILTSNGTLMLRLEKSSGMAGDEFDPDRFSLLMRALQAVERAAVPGYTEKAAAPGYTENTA